MNKDNLNPDAALGDYDLRVAAVRPVKEGNINVSYRVTTADSREFILQRVNPMFATGIHEDIDTVTAHLEDKGLVTPRLIRNRQGRLFSERDGQIWRLMTCVSGITVGTVTDPLTAAEAAALLARFHKALADLEYRFRHRRSGIHNTARHLQNLRESLDRGRGHPRFGEIEPLATDILAFAGQLPEPERSEDRKVHGDPKITNILFDPDSGAAKCLIDFDTLGEMPLCLELGDALRSWCNPCGEDAAESEFSLSLFESAVRGYAREARGFILDAERRSILTATRRIYAELAARFCADALNESYFNWDPQQFNSRSEHNEIRARGQLQAGRSLQSQYRQAERIMEEVFGADTE